MGGKTMWVECKKHFQIVEEIKKIKKKYIFFIYLLYMINKNEIKFREEILKMSK